MSRHVPVLLEEAMAFLAPQRSGLFVDCTVGLGGHAEAILERSQRSRVLGIDCDPHAIALTADRLRRFGARVRLLEGRFETLEELVRGAGEEKVAGVLADLGVSSLQLERPERGFSFQLDGPLDMRMGRGPTTAEAVVNQYPERELERVFRCFGEERQARRIARAILAQRAQRPIRTTGQLRRLIVTSKGSARREGRVDPATRVFQALRIEVNRELDSLEEMIAQAVRMLDAGGRLVVISYHSLEDRIVKNQLRRLARGLADPVTGRPRAETVLLELLTRRPVRPEASEIAANPRSRSARLRAAERL